MGSPASLGTDLLFEIVVGVFGFPDAVDEGEVVNEGSAGTDGLLGGAFEGVLLNEVPVVGRAAFFEEVGEGGAGVAFGGVALAVELREGGVIGLDGLVRRL